MRYKLLFVALSLASLSARSQERASDLSQALREHLKPFVQCVSDAARTYANQLPNEQASDIAILVGANCEQSRVDSVRSLTRWIVEHNKTVPASYRYDLNIGEKAATKEFGRELATTAVLKERLKAAESSGPET